MAPETFSRVDVENIEAVKGVLRIQKDYDICRGQPAETTIEQFHEAASAQCGEDKDCQDKTFNKLVSGEYSLAKAAKGAADGSALGLIPLAAGSSTASWGKASLAGAVIGLLSSGRGQSLKECTRDAPHFFNEKGERILLKCGGWDYKSEKIPYSEKYTGQEKADMLLASTFDKSYILEGQTIVNTNKKGMMIQKRCSIMTEEDFEHVLKYYPIKLSEPVRYVKKETE